MKKILCIVLAVFLCLPLLAACGTKTATPAGNNNGTQQNNQNNAASQQAAQQQADKEAIANAFSAESILEAFQRVKGSEQGSAAGQGNEQGEEQGEETLFSAPLALAEMLAATAEAYVKAGNAEVALDVESPFSQMLEMPSGMLFSLKDGVLYGCSDDGACGYCTLNQGVLTEIGGLPFEADEYDVAEELVELLSDEIGYYLYKMTRIDLDDYMDEEIPTEQIETMVNTIVAALPAMTANDLVADAGGVYLLTNDYIVRFVIALGESSGFFASMMGVDPAAPAPADAADQIAEAMEEVKAMIAETVPALGVKIGFKLTGNDISALVLRFVPTEETSAALRTLMPSKKSSPNYPDYGNQTATAETQPAPSSEGSYWGDDGSYESESPNTWDMPTTQGPSCWEEEPGWSSGFSDGEAEEGEEPSSVVKLQGVGYEYETEEEDDEEEEPLFVPGTQAELVLTVSGGLPTGFDLTLVVPDEINIEEHMTVAYTSEGYPTRLDVTVNVPGKLTTEAHYVATYAQNVVTAFSIRTHQTMYDMCIKSASVGRDGPDATDEDRQWAELRADVVYHLEGNFDAAAFAPTATGQPLYAAYSVSFTNLKHLVGGAPVASFDNVQFTYADADMSDPAGSSFTLTSENNGQGLVRVLASMTEGEGQPAKIAGLDIVVGSAPNFVAKADNPFTELSDVVTKLLASENVQRGNYAYAVGDIS